VDLSNTIGYNNTLYFPHKGLEETRCGGSWLSSLATQADDGLLFVHCFGGIWRQDNNPYAGVRPVVYLPNNIVLNTEGNVWSVIE